MLNSGDILDEKYRIIKLIGTGGMGRVYLANNIKIGNCWAIKEIDLQKQLKSDVIAEAEILKKVNHPGLPRIIDIVERGESLFIVEDYFPGRNLKEILKNRQLCTEENVIKWGMQICEILGYLHGLQPNPIIYRDMKPSNIIVDDKHNARLVDLGIAREYKQGQESDTLYIGTRGYAAPEQYAGENQSDQRTDIYGLGATLYHVLTGHNPNEPPYQMLPVRQFNRSLSEDIERIIKKCTQNDPDQRFQEVEELQAEFEKLKNKRNLPKQAIAETKPWDIAAKLIVIGSLSPRSGSSFITANLAAAMAKRKLPTAVVEFPVNVPYLYDALFLRQKTDGKYISWAHEIRKGGAVSKKDIYVENGVNWLVLDPTLQAIQDWASSDMLNLIYSIKHIPVVLLDVSTNWSHPAVSSICNQADHIFLIIDPDPVLLDRTIDIDYEELRIPWDTVPRELQIIKMLTGAGYSENGNVGFIINKFTGGVESNELGLGLKPLAYIAHMDPGLAYKALWRGEVLYSDESVTGLMDRELLPMLKHIFPSLSPLEGDEKNSILSRMKNVYGKFRDKKEGRK